jgi:hypothetical protein
MMMMMITTIVVFLVAIQLSTAIITDEEPSTFNDDINPFDQPQSEPITQILKLSGYDRPLGQVSGLGVDSDQHLHIFHRASRDWDHSSFDSNNKFQLTSAINDTVLLVVDPITGRVLRTAGRNQFYMPHGLTIDNDDNLWVTDVGMHQIFKFEKGSDKPSLTLGVAFEPGADDNHFCKPTDIAVATNGDFFVADGYCNSRVMKFDRHGNLLAKFGTANEDFPINDGQFRIPHSIALIEDMNLVCVADRENERIQCFSAGIAEGIRSIPTGLFITKAENIGRVFAIREKAHYLIGVTGSDLLGTTEPQAFIMDVNNGKAHTFAKGIGNAHSLAISDTGTVYIGQIGPNQIVQVSFGRAN